MFGDREIENSFDALFDLNRDGVLDPLEQGYQLDVISGEFDNEGTEDEDEFDLDDLDLMDEDELRKLRTLRIFIYMHEKKLFRTVE